MKFLKATQWNFALHEWNSTFFELLFNVEGATEEEYKFKHQGPYSQHAFFFVTYKLDQ